jgi:hypothetical protein
MPIMRISETTDNRWLGMVFEVEDPNNPPREFIVPGGYRFVIDKVQQYSENAWRYSNPNYIVIAVQTD